MRLLLLSDSGEFSFTRYFVGNDKTPPYAILSHTWGEDTDEVTFEDLTKGTGKDKPGYEKIRFCGEQARKDGLQYFWMDTCCIDKVNSTELSKAINSMFRWFQNSAKCYVYLSDVSTAKWKASDDFSKFTWEPAFRESRWFTRCWTLLELLAPGSVEFFSREGKRLGDKRSLERQIHEITGIAILALQGVPLSQFGVDERLLWAKNRQTTCEEDKAYSLLGIFDIHMPLIYGEGKENAFRRLREELNKASHGNVFSSQEATPHTWIVPFERNPRFTGRESQLTKLEEIIFAADQTTKTAITGLGGVGKTQLVLELVYRIRTKHKNFSIIWIPALNREILKQAYLHVAKQLGISGCEDDKVDIKRQVQDYLCGENAGQWVLVFDNADDIDMWIGKFEQGSSRLIDYLPKSKRGSIIFTTRDRKTAVKLARQNIVEVSEMDEAVAMQLLQKCLVNQDLVNSQDTTALLAQLTYLPLAIVQAAAFINENGLGIGDYLLLLAEQEGDVIDLLSEDFEDEGRYHSVKNPVATTWLISFEQIRQRDPLAADFLSFMACTDPKDIPSSLLPPGQSRRKEINAIGTLNAYSFITMRPAYFAIDVHRLVHLATRNWLRKEELLAEWTKKVIVRLEEVFPGNDYRNRSFWRVYLPHARYALESDLIDRDWQTRLDLMWRCGLCLYEDGRYNEAEVLVGRVTENRIKVLGAKHPDTLTSMAKLASTYRNQGRWKEAEELDVQTMETRKRMLGTEHPDTLTSMANLASIYRNQGRWEEAEELEVQAMETREIVLGAEHPDTLTSMANLALTYRNQGRLKEAEELFVQVIETFKRVLGVEHPDMLTSMASLASTYRNQGRWKEAEELFLQVMETRKRVLGAEHPDTLTSMANLALTYRNQGRLKEAEELFVQVMEMRKRVLGADHPDTLTSMANLASTYQNQGRWKEAEELEVQVMETRKRVLGADHPSTLTSIGNLASTYRNQGRWKEAEELEVQVMETKKRVLGAEHSSTLTSMANLASTFWNQGRWKEAEELEVQVMETRKRVLGSEHPSTLTSMANLASTFWNQGRRKEAEELFMQVMETFKRVLGTDHPDTLTSIANLASTFWNQGRWKEAEELFLQVMETFKRVLGADHPDTLTSMANLASTYRNQGRWKEAEELEVQVMEIRKRVLGADHLDTLTSMANLASTYRNQGRWKEAEELDVSDAASTEHPSAFWSDQAGSTNPSSLSQIAVDMEQVTDSRSPMTFYRYKEPAIEHKPDKRDDDIQSVESIPDDINSLAESTSGIVHYRQAAVNYIVKIFTADSELVALYQEATHSMDKAKFVENHRRLLKRFFLDLRSEGHTPSQKLAVGFLRSRSKRIHISSEIRRLVMPSDNTAREKINIMLKQEQGSLSLLDRFLDEKDSVVQLAPTNTADETSDGEPIVQPRVRDNADTTSEESEDSGNDEDMSGDESEAAIEDDSTLSKLAATAEFLTSGRPFGLYKENLRAFLHPVHKAAHLQNLHSGIQARRTEGSELFGLDYDVSSARGFNSAIQDICKRGIEHIAGCQLSWWPLSGPEDELKAGHIRVYSMPFRGRRFYDDIPTTLAESLFPKLSNARACAPKLTWEFLNHKAVFLHDTTLMRLLLSYFALKANMGTTERGMFGKRGHTRSAAEPTSSSTNSRQVQVAQMRGGASATGQIDTGAGHSDNKLKKRKPRKAATKSGVRNDIYDDDGQDNPVLFLSINTGLNESIARTIAPGINDKATFQCLREAYQSISSGWCRLKRVTGIKFYRFHGFLFKETLNFLYIDIHKDKERYPEALDPEYGDYRYRPRPWPSGTPYPSREVWHYFMHPEDCGTSRELKEMLPVRVNGPIAPHSRAFGMHIEERYSILVIFIPASIMVLLTLGATLWFIPPWLNKHPDDLQNATVPVMMAFTVVGFFVQLLVSLLIFRWTNS